MRITLLVCAALVSVLVRTSAFAQDPTGTIEGAVADKTGSVIPAARVTATNLETGFTREVAAADDGFYRLLLLPVGGYSVTVEAPQFAKLVEQPIQVNVSQTVRVNAQLELSVAHRNRDRHRTTRSSSTRPPTRSAGSSPGANWSTCRSTAATSRSSACCRPVSRRSPPASRRRAAACVRDRPTRSTACGPSRTCTWWTARRTSTAWTAATR